MQLVHRGSKMLLDESCSNSIVQCKHWILCVSISISKWNEKLGQMQGSQLEKSLILQILSLGWTTKLMILLPSNPKQPGNGGSGKQPYWCQNAHHRLKYLKQKEPSTTFMCVCSALSCTFIMWCFLKTGAFVEYLGVEKMKWSESDWFLGAKSKGE